MIESLNQGLIKAEVEDEAKLKYKPRLLSKSVGIVEPGETVCCYYTTSKGWRLIRKEDGTIRICKSKYSIE